MTLGSCYVSSEYLGALDDISQKLLLKLCMGHLSYTDLHVK